MGSLAGIEPPRAEAPHVAPVPVTMAGLYVYRRFCINPVIADLVASLAGLGSDRRTV